jgi:hypothetical protein
MRQVEAYFRSIRGEMRLLAAPKMVVDAMRGFRATPSTNSDRKDVPPDIRQKVDGWYNDQYMPMVRRPAGPDTPVKDFLPGPVMPYFLQGTCISSTTRIPGTPQPARRSRRRQRLLKAARGSITR